MRATDLRIALLAAAAVLAACRAPEPAPLESVKPGINDDFLDPELDPREFVQRFEVESREIFASRTKIARAVGLRPGMAVADIGAGTGLFTEMFAGDVGKGGRVYAVDISPKLIEHIRARAQRKNLAQVEAVLCSDRSVDLPAGSVDVLFVCDTYHHFEYPAPVLASMRKALRPGGTLVVVDFERIPGASREWILDHVRAGKEVFVAEIEAAGFRKIDEVAIDGLKENYFVRFSKG
jgi:SAM-dependent methyltransferase